MKKILLALLFSISLAYGQEQSISMFDFSGGLDTNDPGWRVPDTFSPYMRNVFIDDFRVQGIKGYQTLGSTNTLSKITGIFPYNRDNGQTTFLVTDSSLTLETSDFRTWTFVSSNSNTGSLLKWTQVRQKMWGHNGLDFVMTWDGTTKKVLNGSNNTPNVPRFKYAEYWQERVWGFNNPNDASSLDFSDVASTDGVRIEPDDYRAWPTYNNLRIGQGDGQIGTALWVQDGQLRVGKERSIYTVFGKNVSDYFPRKEESIGDGVVSDESVVLLDNSAYWIGQDGIYKNGERISDLIEDDFNLIKRQQSQVLSNIWDTQLDFSKGKLFGSTITADGFVTMISTTWGIPPSSVRPNIFTIGADSTPPWNIDGSPLALNTGTTFYEVNFKLLTSSPIVDYAKVYLNRVYITNDDDPATDCTLKFASVTVRNSNTGIQNKTVITDFGGIVDSYLTADFTNLEPKVFFTGEEIIGDKLYVKVEGCGIRVYMDSTQLRSQLLNSTTNQFISEISTLTSVTSWGNFNSVNNTNGGTINYYIRSATSVVNIATQTWIPVSAGAIINQPTQNNYIQWASTITSVSTTPVTNIDNVEILHIEGITSFNRPFGIGYKNRYWLSTSTGSDTLSYILVKAKITNKNPIAWMPIEGINIRSFAKNNNILYGGSSSTGSVYRLDYGTSFDGNPIEFIYDTPDMILGDNYRSKNIKRYMLDAKRDSGLIYSVKTSLNTGDFTSQDFSFNGTGRQLQEIFGVKNPAKSIRVRVTHRLLDKIFELYDISVLYDLLDVLRQ